jgi:cytochrome c oxidase subunit II
VKEAPHFRRVILWWLLCSVILTPIVVIVLAPGMPPGNGTDVAAGQVIDNTVLFGIATPITMAVIVFFVYSLIVFRDRGPQVAAEGPAVRGHAGIQLWWIVVTTGIVLFLAAYGSVRMLENGAGGGQGPNPIAPITAAHGTKVLPVQVIAQQWRFDYRFPTYGGVQTSSIELPANTTVAFHVTSLDVIHSFWAYQLGVKADANPGVDNVAYATTRGPLTFNIHCAELCGVWHGYMFATGHVVPKAQFAAWIAARRRQFAPSLKHLGPYRKTYFPQPLRRGG